MFWRASNISHIVKKKKKQDTTLQVLYKNTWTGKEFNSAIVVLSCQEDLMSDLFLFILSLTFFNIIEFLFLKF